MKCKILILNKQMARREISDNDYPLESLYLSDFPFASELIMKADIVVVFDSSRFREMKNRIKPVKEIFSLDYLSEYLRIYK